MTRLVIFDLDHTLSRVNVSFAFGKYLYQVKALSFFSMCVLVLSYALHKVGFLAVRHVHESAFRQIFSKHSVQFITDAVNSFLQKNQPTLFRPGVVSCLKDAQNAKIEIWIQSSSPECIVLPIGKYFGVSTVFATRYLVNESGEYVGIEEVIDGEKKRAILDDFLESNHLLRKEVTAYSDSMLDLPLLEGVGTVIAVNPEKKLKKIAKMRDWQIWQE